MKLALFIASAVVLLFLVGTILAAVVQSRTPSPDTHLDESLFRPVILHDSGRAGRVIPFTSRPDREPAAVSVAAERAPAVTASPPDPPPEPSTSGVVSWYPARGMIAAVHSWHWGDTPYRLTICATRCIVVTVQDYCAGCVGPRLADLSDDAFRQLAPLSQGIVEVEVKG